MNLCFNAKSLVINDIKVLIFKRAIVENSQFKGLMVVQNLNQGVEFYYSMRFEFHSCNL